MVEIELDQEEINASVYLFEDGIRRLRQRRQSNLDEETRKFVEKDLECLEKILPKFRALEE